MFFLHAKKELKKIKIVTLEIPLGRDVDVNKGLKIWIFIAFKFIILFTAIFCECHSDETLKINNIKKIETSSPHLDGGGSYVFH